MAKTNWPAWHYGPGGEARIFKKAEDVPEGWADTPAAFEEGASKRGGKPKLSDFGVSRAEAIEILTSDGHDVPADAKAADVAALLAEHGYEATD